MDVNGVHIYFVHASYLQVTRRRLWQQLESINDEVPWLVIGNFNCILRNEEKKGGLETRTSVINEFSDWMENNNLFEADSLGCNFTWTNGQSGHHRIISKLDRAIINPAWPQRAPFRIQKMWFLHADLMRMVTENWNMPVFGNPDFIFPFKLKRLKIEMKAWNFRVVGNIHSRLKQDKLRFEMTARISDEDPSNIPNLNSMKDAMSTLHDTNLHYITMLKQKARNNWLVDGASNTTYFHNCIRTRRSSNVISELVDNVDNVITDNVLLRDHVVSYYEDKFNGPEDIIEDTLFDYNHESISPEESLEMDAIPDAEEIKKVVWDLGADSAPGPDGFSGCFYQQCWDVIQEDLIQAITYCWTVKKIPNGSNSSLLILLAKVRGANSLRSFRPIGLSKFFFKIFTKILATHLGKVLDKLVSEEQVSFMKGRNIHENITLASEMINELHIKRKDGNIGLKLDISQDFDTKSKVYYSVGSLNKCRYLTDFLGMSFAIFPDRYLGVQVMPGTVRYRHISNIIDKIKNQLAGWKGRLLSFQDRIVLVKSVVAGYSIHNMAVYKWPRKFVLQCERAIRNFIWTGDANTRRSFVVGYDKVCTSYEEGGIGLTSMTMMNKSLIMKLWWQINTSKKKWAKYLIAKFFGRNGALKRTGIKSTILPGIRWVYDQVEENTKALIGDGRSTSLYFDIWYAYESIANILQNQELDKNVRVSELLVDGTW
ncbi:uncharacterized protein LOC113356584 [Papaver somniferum]|uniref:uncharacterized protein LOC113356584 n=1 Tax=Papaver somniferum TaxID=3469 RepID=UPI000E6FAEF5|nr:uncharacterized protein LOC113356584 [Papaver somniferum]